MSPEMPQKLLVCRGDEDSDYITWEPTGLSMDSTGDAYITVEAHEDIVAEAVIEAVRGQLRMRESYEESGVRRGLRVALEATDCPPGDRVEVHKRIRAAGAEIGVEDL